ncbi:hypothetical protein KBY30_20390 [Ruegeria pomeroyi]|nr:hypothetical protein [Ruegeria pomeroyi]
MKKLVFALLLVTNVATAYELWVSKLKIQTLTSNRTTDKEREVFGEACVSWLSEKGREEDNREGEFYLGRSWKKHGQLVFEVIGPKDAFRDQKGEAICTYDKQSGIMYAYYGPAQERWLFY